MQPIPSSLSGACRSVDALQTHSITPPLPVPFHPTAPRIQIATTLARVPTTLWMMPAGSLARGERLAGQGYRQQALGVLAWPPPALPGFSFIPRVPYQAVARTFQKIEEVSAR